MFGKDPSISQSLNVKLHTSMKDTWVWAKNGIEQEEKEALMKKCKCSEGFETPDINPEIILKLLKHSKSADDSMVKKHRMTSLALGALGSIIINLIKEE